MTTADVTADWTTVVLTGGSGTRFGGQRKAEIVLDEVTLLERVLRGLPAGVPVVVVGPQPPATSRAVIVTRESPSGAGPVAALAAALEFVKTPIVGLIATDMPFASGLLADLVAHLPPESESESEADALVPIDASGHRQPLCAAYRSAALRRAVQALGTVANASMRSLLEQLAVVETSAAVPHELHDIDTPSDLDHSRAIIHAKKETTLWMSG